MNPTVHYTYPGFGDNRLCQGEHFAAIVSFDGEALVVQELRPYKDRIGYLYAHRESPDLKLPWSEIFADVIEKIEECEDCLSQAIEEAETCAGECSAEEQLDRQAWDLEHEGRELRRALS